MSQAASGGSTKPNAPTEKPIDVAPEPGPSPQSAGSLDAIKVTSEYSATIPNTNQFSGFNFSDQHPRTLSSNSGSNLNYEGGISTMSSPSHVTIHIGYNANSPSNEFSAQAESSAPFDFGYIHRDVNFKPSLPSRSKSLPLPTSPSANRNPTNQLQRMKSDPLPSKGARDKLVVPRRPVSGCITLSSPLDPTCHQGNNDNDPVKTHYFNFIPYYVSLGSKTYVFPTMLTCLFIFFVVTCLVILITLFATAKKSNIGKDVWFTIIPLGAIIGFSFWGIWGFRVKVPPIFPQRGIDDIPEETKKYSALDYGYNIPDIPGGVGNRVIVDITLDEKQKTRQTKIDDLEAQMFKVLAELGGSRRASANSADRVTEIKEVTPVDDPSSEQGKGRGNIQRTARKNAIRNTITANNNNNATKNRLSIFSSAFSPLRFSATSWPLSVSAPTPPPQAHVLPNISPSTSSSQSSEIIPGPCLSPMPSKPLPPTPPPPPPPPPPAIPETPPPPPRRQLTGPKRPSRNLSHDVEGTGVTFGKLKRSDSNKAEERRRRERTAVLRKEFGDVVEEISGPIH